MNREAMQPMRTTLNRFVSTWSSKMLKKPKGRGVGDKAGVQPGGAIASEAAPVVELDGSAVSIDTMTNLDWQTGMVLTLPAQGVAFDVVVDPPAVLTLATFPCRSAVSAGLPITPLVTHEFCDAVTFAWYAETTAGAGNYSLVCSGATFSPGPQHVGCKVKVFAAPTAASPRGKIRGRPAVYYIPSPVAPALPAPACLSCRREFSAVERGASPSTRVVCWNLLAEPFATSDYAKNVMFAYCPAACLETEYRLQLVAAELQAYAGDVLCLQEVDARAFAQYLQPVLAEQGYRGWYLNKSSSVREGCAFFASPRVRVHGCFEVPIGKLLAARSDLAALFAAKPWVRDILTEKLGTVAQLALCERLPQQGSSQQPRFFLVGNTHLFYHPRAAYVRLLQIDTIARAAQRLSFAAWSHIKAHGGSAEGFEHAVFPSGCGGPTPTPTIMPIPLLLCGDFNSTPETAVVEYLERGFIGPAHEVWASLHKFRWGRREEGGALTAEGETLGAGGDAAFEEEGKEDEESCKKHWTEGMTEAELSKAPPVPASSGGLFPTLLSPCGQLVSSAGYPEFTNYTAGFRDTLDYVFVPPDRVCVALVAPFPEEAVLRQHTALPSAVFPSDHLAVCVDIEVGL